MSVEPLGLSTSYSVYGFCVCLPVPVYMASASVCQFQYIIMVSACLYQFRIRPCAVVLADICAVLWLDLNAANSSFLATLSVCLLEERRTCSERNADEICCVKTRSR